MTTKLNRCLISALFIFAAMNTLAYSPQEVAVVLLHGKWATPPGPLANYFESQGYTVVSPTMPWSRLRNYDISYEDEIEELHQQVQKLRDTGSKIVVLGGHSFGANGVLAYLSKYQDVDGAMIFAPGHAPERFYRSGLTKESVDAARDLVSQGKAANSFDFTDYNQARNRQMTSTVAVYLSYYDPNGLANMPKNAASIQKSIPFFCVMSSAEQFLGKDYIYSKLPPNSLSVYIESPAPHMQAPEASVNEVSGFIRGLVSN
jgi:pimeloyl-ACP methyl ester carboxylesterase